MRTALLQSVSFWWRPARCAAGSLNPHPVLGVALDGLGKMPSARKARWQGEVSLFTGILHRGSRPHISPKRKRTAFAVRFFLVEIPARCAAGSLNPHPGLRPGWARCPPLAGSLSRGGFFVNGHLAQGISSAYFTKKKTDCFCSPFLFGGDKGSRTPDLLNAIQALSQLSYTPKWLRCFLDNDDIISQHLLFVNRFLKSFFRKKQLVRRCQNKESSTLFRWLTRQTIPPTPVGRINKICPCFFMLPQALFP